MKTIISKFILGFVFFCAAVVAASNLCAIETKSNNKDTISKQAEQNKPHQNKFNYTFQTEFAFNDNNGVKLDPSIDSFARSLHGHLNQARFFDTSFVRDERFVRDFYLNHEREEKNKGHIMTIKTEDGFELDCTFFDRGGSRLLIVFEGFTNCREYMIPFVHMFNQEGETDGTDILLVDFRGHGFKPFRILDFDSWNLNLAKRTFGINSIDVTLGRTEHLDVFAVVDHFKKEKKYKQMYGLGLCYGSFIIAKAQAMRCEENIPLFDKIILDGCWQSLDLVLKKILNDPLLIFTPQRGGCQNNWFTKSDTAKSATLWLVQNIWGIELNDLKISDYLPKIKNTPVLFFYGKDDLLVERQEFEILWNSLSNTKKAAVITSNPHVWNHLKQKELYKLLCDLFFDLPFDQFTQVASDLDTIKQHYAEKLLTFRA